MTSDICILYQHPDGIFQETRQRLHELRGFYPKGYDVGSVADAMVNGDGGFRVSAGSLFLL